jgi:radical SAM superfamily enzyme YgiQ (UPF0313 family)
MKAMKEAGCRLLDVGFESGNDEMLRVIRKGISTEEMLRFAEDARQAKLMLLGDFVFGLPGETKETAEKTIEFARKLKCNIAQFAVSTPIPGTEFHTWAEKNGFLLIDNLEESIDDNGFQRCIVSYPEFTDRDIEYYVNRALKQYYLSPFFIPIALRNIWRRNGWYELKGMAKSARSFFQYLNPGK